MDLTDLFGNRVLISILFGWLTAQILKVIISIIKTRLFDSERIYGAGGMPSSHSCMVSALVISIGMTEGIRSAVFALAVAFAFVTIYDSMGVRRQAGLHAKLLNKYIRVTQTLQDHEEELQEPSEEWNEPVDLKEFIGHNPLEVLVGVLLGIITAIFVCMF